MPQNWDEQEAAFFGSSENSKKNGSADSKVDEELAKKLQEHFLEEQQRLKKDEEMARKLQGGYEERSADRSGRLGNGLGDRNGSKGFGFGSAFGSGFAGFMNRKSKSKQEEEDAALAKAMQAEEQSIMSPATSLPPSSNNRPLGNGSSGVHTYPGQRRNTASGLAYNFPGPAANAATSTQEEEDAALARAIQEEEEAKMPPSSTIPPASSNRPGNRSSGAHIFPGQRRSRVSDYPGPAATATTSAPASAQKRGSGLVPMCAVCNQMVLMPVSALGNLYHAECFKCMGCHDIIRPNERFAYIEGDDGIKHPLHKQCYTELYSLKCTVCQQILESDENGRISYMKHPFFEGEYMCPKHSNEQYRKCTGCNRFEPITRPFADLNDANRCVCDACLRSVIVDSADAKPLFDNVLQFFEQSLKLPIWSGMKEIPVLIVGHNALNDQMRTTGTGAGQNHGGSSQIMTRGLCLSEHQRGFNFMLPRMRFDRKRSSFLPSDAESKGHTYFQIPDASSSNPHSNVTAILCLSGLPADLTASILAHEATHAWIKLNPHFNISRPIPAQVEEGCCQLVAMLYLTDGLKSACQNSGGSGPSDKKLRQYFKFSIESDPNEIYGEGYRKAAKAYANIGLEALLSHVVNYQEFPST